MMNEIGSIIENKKKSSDVIRELEPKVTTLMNTYEKIEMNYKRLMEEYQMENNALKQEKQKVFTI